MNKNNSLFSQILKLFPRSEFQRHAYENKAEKHARGKSCWDQFTAILFAQCAKAPSLSEIVNGLNIYLL